MVLIRGGSAGFLNTLELPSGTQIGDLLICADWNHAFNDPRLSKIEGGAVDGVWIGYATSLDPLVAASGPGTLVCVSLPRAPITTWSMNAGDLSPAIPPSMSASGVVLVSTFTDANLGGTAGMTQPPGYTLATQATQAIAGIRIDYWNGTAPSPADSFSVSVNTGGVPSWRTIALVPGAPRAPAARKYPRSDGLGFGSGRIFPPSSTQQAGRLTGPY